MASVNLKPFVKLVQHEARINLKEQPRGATVTHKPYEGTIQSYRDKQIDKVIDTLEGRKGFYVLREELGDDMIRKIAGDIVDAL